ncbi:unnamed protein product [Symbiodinium microadriaticum]|nr:unnamed protein product [Symbiodinium microadriaticum]
MPSAHGFSLSDFQSDFLGPYVKTCQRSPLSSFFGETVPSDLTTFKVVLEPMRRTPTSFDLQKFFASPKGMACSAKLAAAVTKADTSGDNNDEILAKVEKIAMDVGPECAAALQHMEGTPADAVAKIQAGVAQSLP